MSDLEDLTQANPDLDALAAALVAKYKPGSAKAVAKALAPLTDVEAREARKKLLAVTAGSYELSERLLPFYNLTRTDLRGLPVIVQAGALYVTESNLRSSTGTHASGSSRPAA